MSPEELTQINKTIKDAIEQGIELNVNGKIRRLDAKLDAYILQDNEWKAVANPTIKLGNDIRGFGKVLAYLLGIVATLVGIIYYSKK